MEGMRGFTLIELMIVVVIIGLLAGMAIPNLIAMQDRAKEAKVKDLAHTLHLTVEDYGARHDGVYSDDAADLLPLMPQNQLLQNAFTRELTEPQFGAVAATPGQLGVQTVAVDGADLGYAITGFGRSEQILRISNGF